MISLPINGALFNYRVAGVAIVNGKVLLHKTPADNYWTLPGGRAELFEFSGNTLRREMQEETGMEVEVGQMLWVSENFFLYNGTRYHEIGFYFLMEIADLANQDDFLGAEGDDELLFKWHNMDDLGRTSIYPEFLADELSKTPLSPGNFTSDFRDLDA